MTDFETSKSMFIEFTQSISKDADRYKFFLWLKEELLPEVEKSWNGGGNIADEDQRNVNTLLAGSQMLERISADIRTQIPQEAVFPSENIVYPSVGEDSNLTAVNSVHVDAFLYDESGEDALVEEGDLSRSYCRDCGSRNCAELTFITHSCSRDRLEYIFTSLLPPLQGKTVIDIGSRIGAVLYGAYYYSGATKILGIEMNSDMCRLQRSVVEKYKLGDRISVLEGEMTSLQEVIRTGDVVVLNNVFDWFLPPELQVTMWKFLRGALSPGSLLVTIPSLDSSLQHLNTGISLSSWLTPLQPCSPGQHPNQVETSEVCLYQVKR